MEEKNPFIQALSQDNKIVENKQDKVKNSILNQTAEDLLSKLAKIVLWISIIGCGILVIAGFGNIVSGEEDLGAILLLSSIVASFFLLVQWALLRIIVNISNSLKEINGKLPQTNK